MKAGQFLSELARTSTSTSTTTVLGSEDDYFSNTITDISIGVLYVSLYVRSSFFLSLSLSFSLSLSLLLYIYIYIDFILYIY